MASPPLPDRVGVDVKTHAVKVIANPFHDGVEVDGKPMNGVRRVEIDYAVGNLAEVTLHLDVITGAAFESENALVVVPAWVHDGLVALGWTPPEVTP